MRFRTELNLPQSPANISHQDSSILMGSCFTTHIGRLLSRFKFKTLVNPYGTIYHPKPLFHQLKETIGKSDINSDQVIQVDDRYLHFEYHSDCWGHSIESLMANINQRREKLRSFLENTNLIFFTLGSAFHYVRSSNGTVVANCHKQPASLFKRRLSPIEEIAETLVQLIELISNSYSDIRIIFTVSPVRHLNDGLIQNTRSKAHLIAAVQEVCTSFGHVSYFPAYEIMMDDLRDYRFYNADLIHPNDMAIDYIWNHFKSMYFSVDTDQIINQIMKFEKTINHRAFNPESEAHQATLIKLRKRILEFQAQHQISFEHELESIQRTIISNDSIEP